MTDQEIELFIKECPYATQINFATSLHNKIVTEIQSDIYSTFAHFGDHTEGQNKLLQRIYNLPCLQSLIR